MTIKQWQKVKGVFLTAIELEATEREKFLRVTCRNDSRLRGEVESLLCSHQGAGDFIQKPVFVTADGLFDLNNHDDLFAGQRVARYEIEREIGRGGMGAVYLARDTSLGRRVTLKFIGSFFFDDAENVRRFEREAYAASALNHPNILTVHELGEWNETRFIAAEFVEGETLRQRLERDGRVSVAEALKIAAQIASALAAAHAAGIVHRDIKPENIMLRPDGLVKILDFGIAKLADHRAPDFANGATTQPGLIVGTPKYMSPEQARGLPVDSRADLWSLGCVLYEMTTGCAAFTGETTSDLIAAVLEREPVACAEHIKIAPAELQRIISKALMKKADERYQTIAEMATDLQRLERQWESGDEIPTVSDERASATNDRYASPKRGQGLQSFFFITARALAFAALLAAVATLGYTLFFRNSSVGNQPEIKSLAVLPFKSFAREADDHLGIGIADTVIGKVSRIDGMIVRPTSAVQKYGTDEINSLEAARQLGVDAVLEGSVQRAGDRLRVGANLLRTSDGASLWTESFDMRFTDIFTIEDEVSKQVAAHLRLKFNAAETARFAKRYTANAEAYEHYARGVQIFNGGRVGRYGGDKIRAATEEFKRAVEVDPNYALARAQLAYCYALVAVYYETGNPNWLGLARQEIRAADALDNELAETHLARYEIYFSVYENFQIEEAVRELRLAQQLDPNAGHIQMAHLYGHLGLEAPALRELQRAMEIDPTSDVNRGRYIGIQEMLGKSDEAIAAGIRFFPNQPERGSFYSYLWANRLDEAQKSLDAGLIHAPDDENLQSVRVLLLAARGKLPEADAEIPKIAAMAKPSRGYHHLAHDIAAVYALEGKAQKSVEWLRKAADTGLPNYPMFMRDPNFERIRNDEVFVQFMAQLKTRWDKYNHEFR